MDRAKLENLLTKRQAYLETNRALYEDVMEDVATYMLPNAVGIKNRREFRTQKRKATKIYDTTGLDSLQKAVRGIHGYTINPSLEWLKLSMGDRSLDERQDVKEWLEYSEYALYSAFNRSNFYPSQITFLERGIGLGNAVNMTAEDAEKGRIVFLPQHPGDVWLITDAYGDVVGVHRKFTWQARQAEAFFKHPEDKVPSNITGALKANAFQEFEFMHCVYPRDEEDYDKRRLDPKNKPIASVWLCIDAASGQRVIRESGLDFPNFVCWRTELTGRDNYGTGHAAGILPEVMGLNLLVKKLYAAVEKAVEPAWLLPPTMKGRLDLRPKGQNVLDLQALNIKPQPLVSGVDFPVAVDREDRIRQYIKEYFSVDFFMMLAAADKRMTAREVAERQSEKSILLAPMVSGYEREGLDPTVQQTFNIEYIAGRIPRAPDILLETGMPIRIEYVGPFAQTQLDLHQTRGVNKTLETAAFMAQLFPNIADNIDGDETLRTIAEANSSPARMLRIPKEVATIRQQRAKVEAQLEEQAMIGSAAESMKALADADESMGGVISSNAEEAISARR